MNSESIEQKIISIMEFLNNYDEEVSMQSLFSGSSFYKLLLKVGENSFDFTCNLQENTSKWTSRYLNYETLMEKIEQYLEHTQEKYLMASAVDLIELCKKDNMERMVQFFQIVMCLVMGSSSKDVHIQNIMAMRENSQECFVSIIKNALDSKFLSQNKTENKKIHTLRRVIGELEEEKIDLENDAAKYFHTNIDLQGKIEDLNAIIEQLKKQIKQKVSDQQHYHIEQSSNIEHLEDIIEKLKEKMKNQMKQHEQQKIRFNTKIQQYEQRFISEEENEEINQIYKQKYEEIMDQMQKMNTWKKEKAKMQKMMEEKNFALQRLHERLEELSQKNIVLEEKQLDLNLQIEQKNIKIKKLSEDLKKAIGGISHYNFEGSMSLDQSVSFKENMSLLADQDEQMSKLRKNNEKILRENRNHKKEILKLQKKCQKLRILEQDKKRLEVLVYELRNTQNQELNLLTSVFIEGYIDIVDIKKHLKHYNLNISDKVNEQIRRRSSSSTQNQLSNQCAKYRNSSFKQMYDQIAQ